MARISQGKIYQTDSLYSGVTEKKNWNSAVRQKKVMSERNQGFNTWEEGGGSRCCFAR